MPIISLGLKPKQKADYEHCAKGSDANQPVGEEDPPSISENFREFRELERIPFLEQPFITRKRTSSRCIKEHRLQLQNLSIKKFKKSKRAKDPTDKT